MPVNTIARPAASAVTLTMGDAQDIPAASEETNELSF